MWPDEASARRRSSFCGLYYFNQHSIAFHRPAQPRPGVSPFEEPPRVRWPTSRLCAAPAGRSACAGSAEYDVKPTGGGPPRASTGRLTRISWDFSAPCPTLGTAPLSGPAGPAASGLPPTPTPATSSATFRLILA